MRFILFYEGMERELQNAYLLKSELNKRGHDLIICNPFYMLNVSKEVFDIMPDAILTPYLYEEYQLDYFKMLFKEKIKRIVNLQYEQILTKKHIETKLHIPDGLKRNAIHICWGEKWKNILIENGVPEKNCIVTGCLNIDMDRERFDSLFKTRKEMAKEYSLNIDKKWIIFLSSFSMVNLTKEREHYNAIRIGKEEIKSKMEIDTNTRYIILEWIKKYIDENDCEFIYRPHPAEELDDYIYNISNKNNKFHIIQNDSIRSWIKVCDKIHTWASTSIVDVYFMKKNCSILRPIAIPEWMHNGLIDEGNFITDYEGFEKFNNNDIFKFPIDKNLILENFYIDEKKYAYELICDVLEDIVNRDIKMNFYSKEV